MYTDVKWNEDHFNKLPHGHWKDIEKQREHFDKLAKDLSTWLVVSFYSFKTSRQWKIGIKYLLNKLLNRVEES
jgi:hypothetical protein